jgi:sRNA-binding carbon storage regulator CsrA
LLVIKRKLNERIVIRVPGVVDPVIITVVAVKGLTTTIGVQASQEIRIEREENRS